ncbi:hypothetical protein ABPG72_016063 [Tetrahymena utriculariae]
MDDTETYKQLSQHLENREANKNLFQNKKIQTLSKENLVLQQFQEAKIKKSNVSNKVDIMKSELSELGYSNFKYLGAGNQGCVLLALDNTNKLRYAIKGFQIKDKNGQEFEEDRLAFEKEADLLTKISDQPHSLRLFKKLEGKLMIYLVLNECKGTLKDLIEQEKGQLNIYSAIKYSKDIFENVYYIHKNRFIVQDIKPDNILIDYNDNAVVADFGMGNKLIEMDDYYAQDPFQGNFLFCPPEVSKFYEQHYQIINQNQPKKIKNAPSKRGDCFSLGYLIYCLIFGQNILNMYVTSKDKELEFPQFHDDQNEFPFKSQLKKLILGLTKFIPNERIKLLDALVALKGMTSIILDLECCLNQNMEIEKKQNIENLNFGVEFVQTTKTSFFPILKNQNEYLKNFSCQELNQRENQQLKKQIKELQQLILQKDKEIQYQKFDIIRLNNKLNFYQINSQQNKNNVNSYKQKPTQRVSQTVQDLTNLNV